MIDAPPFELATAELRRLGITLAKLPGEYRVNFEHAVSGASTRPRHLRPTTTNHDPACPFPFDEFRSVSSIKRRA
jgi:hypothetical protein